MKLNKVANLRLGAQSVPFLNLKRDPWSAVFGFFGDMLDSADATATNESNMWQTIATNQANMEMNEQQLAWARQQYEMEKAENRYLIDQAYYRDIEQRDNEREYNSPAKQMERFKAAGINPALAMYGGAGSVGAGGVGSVRSSTGQNPHANQPNMIPMQTGAPAIPYTGFGQGIRDAIGLYYQGKASEREDFKLAADITFRDRELLQKSMDYLLELRKQGANEDWIDKQSRALFRSLALEENKFEHQKDLDEVRNNLDYYNAETQRINAKTQQLLARSQINVDNATIAQISANIAATQVEVEEMIANGVSKREIEKYVAGREKENYEIIKSDRQFHKDFYGTNGNRDVFQRFNRGLRAFGETMFAPIRNLISAVPK